MRGQNAGGETVTNGGLAVGAAVTGGGDEMAPVGGGDAAVTGGGGVTCAVHAAASSTTVVSSREVMRRRAISESFDERRGCTRPGWPHSSRSGSRSAQIDLRATKHTTFKIGP